MAFQRMGSGGSGGTTPGSITTITSGTTISCKNGNYLIIVGNIKTISVTNSELLDHSEFVVISGQYVDVYIYKLTSSTSTITFTVWDSSSVVKYVLIA